MVSPSCAVTSSPSMRTEIVLFGNGLLLSGSMTSIRPTRDFGSVASHPFARKKAKGWGTVCSFQDPSVSLRTCGDSQIAAKTAAAFLERLLRAEAGDHFILRTRSCLRGQGMGGVAAAETWLTRRLAAVFEVREERVPAQDCGSLVRLKILGHEALIDFARGLFAAAHGVGHVGCAGDDVTAGIESGAAGLKRESIDGERALFL